MFLHLIHTTRRQLNLSHPINNEDSGPALICGGDRQVPIAARIGGDTSVNG